MYWDGVPYLPIGRDSLYLDPARVPLVALERIEVIPLPGTLRVHLVSRRQASTHAASAVGIVTGDLDIARYRGTFARRWRSGTGLSLAGDQNDIAGIPQRSTTAFKQVDVWVNLEYTPTPRAGVSYQFLSSSWERDGEDMRVDPWQQKRRDALLRLFVAPRGDGLGPRVQITLANTSLTGDSAVPDRTTNRVLIDAVHTGRRTQASVAVRLGDGRRPFEVEGRASWSPVGLATFSAEGRRSRYDAGRHGRRARLLGGLDLPLGLSLRGEAAWSDDFEAPLLVTAARQETFDVSGAVRWERRWITLDVGGGRRDAFAPAAAPAGLMPIAAQALTPRTDYVRVGGALRPVPWFSLAGWYFDPVQGGGDFDPPTHARVSATFFSRFLRVFPSGVFALRGEVAAESWGSWYAGLTNGTPIELIGATFLDVHVGLQIGDVHAFWTMRNSNAMRASYVPGLDYPKRRQYYGVRWQFRN